MTWDRDAGYNEELYELLDGSEIEKYIQIKRYSRLIIESECIFTRIQKNIECKISWKKA
jgi:hypothetical protein